MVTVRRRPLTYLFGFVMLPAALFVGLAPATAQGLSPLGASSDSRPIDITADSGIEWQQDKQVYIAHGNAVATRGSNEVHADTLTAHYRPSKSKNAEGGNEVYRLDADGHVLIKGPTQTVVGDQAVYDVDQQIGVVTGKNLKLTTATDVVTARDSLEWYDQQQIAVARGDAIAVRADRRIRADVLTAHFIKDNGPTAGGTAKPADSKPPPAPPKASDVTTTAKPTSGAGPLDAGEGSSRISRLDAQGKVVVVTPTDVARGDYGVYNAVTGIVTLLGDVSITRGQDTVRGQYAVVDLKRNVSRMMTVASKPGAPPPRVEGLFFRQENASGANGGQKLETKPHPGAAPKS